MNSLTETFSNSSLDFFNVDSNSKDFILLIVIVLTVYFIQCLNKNQ
jgi:hypothetical protein